MATNKTLLWPLRIPSKLRRAATLATCRPLCLQALAGSKRNIFLPPLTATFILFHSRHAFGRHIKKREPGAIGCFFCFFIYFFSFFSNDDGITRRGHRNVPSAGASRVIMEFADCCCSCLVCTAESTASMQPGNVPSH